MSQLIEGGVYESLLGRPARQILTADERAQFAGQRVLVTGAGGSIGSEIVRQVAACRPSRIVLFDQCEYNLFRIEQHVRDRFPDVHLDPVLGDVRRVRHIRSACHEFHPDVVYHAAAYKHVAMTERAVCAALEANVFGTLNTVRMAAEVGARFVLVSSDKALRPRSVMGASKRLAELVIAISGNLRSRSMVVRFGNVIASSGSVVDVFFDCLRTGRPMNVTDPDATRYFMTAQEAASLILAADSHGRPGNIYWLDMGSPVRIGDLIERLQDLAVAQGFERVPVKIVGLRPGEKLHEELIVGSGEVLPTSQPHIYVARQAPVEAARLKQIVLKLAASVASGDGAGALSGLASAVPEFRPSDQARFAAAAATLSMPRRASFADDPIRHHAYMRRPEAAPVRATA